MVTTTLGSVRVLFYNGACVQTKRTMAQTAVARDMFIQRYWFRLLQTGSGEYQTVMSTQTWSRCVRSQSA
jgi:hypothetical protein